MAVVTERLSTRSRSRDSRSAKASTPLRVYRRLHGTGQGLPRTETAVQGLAARGHPPDAGKQPRERGEAGSTDRLRRDGQGGSQLGGVPPHRRFAPEPPRRRDPDCAERQAGGRFQNPPRRPPGLDRERASGPEMVELGDVPRTRGARPHDVRSDDRGGLVVHRIPRNRPGYVRDLRRMCPEAFRWFVEGPTRPNGRNGWHGGRAAPRGEDERRRLPRRRSRRGPHPPPRGEQVLRPARLRSRRGSRDGPRREIGGNGALDRPGRQLRGGPSRTRAAGDSTGRGDGPDERTRSAWRLYSKGADRRNRGRTPDSRSAG